MDPILSSISSVAQLLNFAGALGFKANVTGALDAFSHLRGVEYLQSKKFLKHFEVLRGVSAFLGIIDSLERRESASLASNASDLGLVLLKENPLIESLCYLVGMGSDLLQLAGITSGALSGDQANIMALVQRTVVRQLLGVNERTKPVLKEMGFGRFMKQSEEAVAVTPDGSTFKVRIKSEDEIKGPTNILSTRENSEPTPREEAGWKWLSSFRRGVSKEEINNADTEFAKHIETEHKIGIVEKTDGSAEFFLINSDNLATHIGLQSGLHFKPISPRKLAGHYDEGELVSPLANPLMSSPAGGSFLYAAPPKTHVITEEPDLIANVALWRNQLSYAGADEVRWYSSFNDFSYQHRIPPPPPSPPNSRGNGFLFRLPQLGFAGVYYPHNTSPDKILRYLFRRNTLDQTFPNSPNGRPSPIYFPKGRGHIEVNPGTPPLYAAGADFLVVKTDPRETLIQPDQNSEGLIVKMGDTLFAYDPKATAPDTLNNRPFDPQIWDCSLGLHLLTAQRPGHVRSLLTISNEPIGVNSMGLLVHQANFLFL